MGSSKSAALSCDEISVDFNRLGNACRVVTIQSRTS